LTIFTRGQEVDEERLLPFLEEGGPLLEGPKLAERSERGAILGRQGREDRDGREGNWGTGRHAPDYRTGSVEANGRPAGGAGVGAGRARMVGQLNR
jgi:hypothetical protein